MVKLSFVSHISAPLPKVWQFFSKFENIQKWDPNTTSVVVQKQMINKIGTTYHVKTIWKGSQQQFTYKMTQYEQMKKIVVQGENSTTRTVDQIIFEPNHQGTVVTYIADIELKHILKIATPFIKDDLIQLAKSAERGFNSKSKELFG